MSKKSASSVEQRLLNIHTKLETWNHFVNDLDIPAELVPAFCSGRAELVKLARPRALTQLECETLFKLVGGLLETNAVLREHAQIVADGAQTIAGGLKGALNSADRLRRLALFEALPSDPEDDEEGG